jgi:prepilin-type N-terminal cleavage/methylation domain-containing protein
MNAPGAKACRNRPFTLIELLTVIAVIAILMGLLFPAISKVRLSAKYARAKGEMNAIIVAVTSYEAKYGTLPFGSTWISDPGDATYNDKYDTLMQILTRVNMTAGGGALNKSGDGNIAGITFLEPPARFATEGYLDPWGMRYIVLMDAEDSVKSNPYDGWCHLYDALRARGGKTHSAGLMQGMVHVYSRGPDKLPKAAFDDVVSWE